MKLREHPWRIILGKVLSIGPGGGDPLIHFHTCVFVCLSTVYVASSIGKKNKDTVTHFCHVCTGNQIQFVVVATTSPIKPLSLNILTVQWTFHCPINSHIMPTSSRLQRLLSQSIFIRRMVENGLRHVEVRVHRSACVGLLRKYMIVLARFNFAVHIG